MACAPIVLGGFPAGHDWIFELTRIAEYRNALVDGQPLPFWAPNLYGGYGSPVFLFYAPGFSWLGTLGLLGPGGIAAAAATAVIATTLIGAACMGVLARAVFGDGPAARVAVVVYVLSPYLLGNTLVRNADAEALGLAVAPLALAGVFEVGRARRRGALLLGAGVAALFFAHNLTVLSMAPLVGAAALLLHARSPRSVQVHVAGGVALGVLAGGAIWLPALTMDHLVRADELLSGDLAWRGRFPPLGHLVLGDFFSAGVVAVLVWGGAIAAAARGSGTRLLAALGTGAAVCLLLQLPASAPLWERVPFLEFFQFPWRFMGPLALLTAVAAGIVLRPALTGPRAGLVEVGVLALCVVNAAPNLAAHRPLDPGTVAESDARLLPEAIRESALRVTVGDEYLPRAASPDRWRTQRPQGAVVPTPGLDARTEVDGRTARVQVEASRAGDLALARWAFPVWSVRVDGRAVPLRADADGAVVVAVPKGSSTVELRAEPPPARRVGAALTVIGLLGFGVLATRPPGVHERRGGTG